VIALVDFISSAARTDQQPSISTSSGGGAGLVLSFTTGRAFSARPPQARAWSNTGTATATPFEERKNIGLAEERSAGFRLANRVSRVGRGPR
jgi:hypothetical protein